MSTHNPYASQATGAQFPPPQGTPVQAPTHHINTGQLKGAAACSEPAPLVFGAPTPFYQTTEAPLPPPQGTPAYVVAPQDAAVSPSAHQVYAAQQPPLYPVYKAQPRGTAESVIGKNIIGIIASALVFIGLIFLGYLVVPMLGDTLKIALMFIISAGITTSGVVLARKYPNTFTRILLGTGLGACFISILLTHLWFHALGDIVAFLLLLAWTVVALLAARWTKSILVGIIAHAGMIVSVCAGYGAALSDERLALLLIYQFVSTAVIIAGNIICCKQLYRLGLFVTLGLMLYASLAMWLHFWGDGAAFASQLPEPFIASAFLVQFAGATALSVLLFASCLKVKDRTAGLWLQAVNIFFWLMAVLLDVLLLAGKLAMAQTQASALLSNYGTVAPMLTATLIALFAAALATVVVRKVRGFDRGFEVLTVSILMGAAMLALFENFVLMFGLMSPDVGVVTSVVPPRLIWSIVPALFLLALTYVDYSKAQHLFAAILVGAELVFAFLFSFVEIERFVRELSGVYAPHVNESLGSSAEMPASVLAYLPAGAAIVWLIILLASAWLCYRLLPQELRMRKSTQNTLMMTLSVTFEAGVGFIILISPELPVSSFLSLVIMLISFVIIALGFWQRSSSLRMYGLIVVLVCVFKLVTIDSAGMETLMRVVAFIGGGLICFGISALYTFAVRRYNT